MAFWHDNWPLAQQRLVDWWNGKGCALHVTAPRNEPWEDLEEPAAPEDLAERWTSPAYRVRHGLWSASQTHFGGVAFPCVSTQIGAGSLGVLMGSEPEYAEDTVWFGASLPDITSGPPLAIDWDLPASRAHLALCQAVKEEAKGRVLNTIPDLIENLDTLCQIHGPEDTIFALMDEPEAAAERIRQITECFFEAYERFYQLVKDEQGGSAWSYFDIWGPGRTCKVQCDAAAMLSPKLFRELVSPELDRQCRNLDYAMYHLDGTQAVPCLEPLLEIGSIKAIEWTPQAGIEPGGSPRWYDLYRRIRKAGKSVQAIGVHPQEVLPLLDACGHEGMFVVTVCHTEHEARRLEQAVYGS